MLSDASLTFLTALLDAPGPSGFETAPARRWRVEAEGFADAVHADVSGNSYATLRGAAGGDAAPLMLAGHIDEIGVMVLHIDEQGFLWFEPIGGWDQQVFVGQRVTLLGHGGPVAGVIGKPAIHLLEKEAREKASKVSELWIDIGAASRAAASARARGGGAGGAGGAARRAPRACRARGARGPRQPVRCLGGAGRVAPARGGARRHSRHRGRHRAGRDLPD